MCERCDKVREEAEAEIRDLMNYHRKVNGPLSTMMKERIAAAEADGILPEDDEAKNFMVESIRMEMIAERAAIFTRACPGTFFHGAPASIIMGSWAGRMQEEEAQVIVGAISVGGLLAFLRGEIDDDESDED
jgi:hypothetical protein